MIDAYPVSAERHTRMRAMSNRGMGGFGLRLMARRGRPTWLLQDGCHILIRWSGERLPLPTLDASGRACEIVGWSLESAALIDTYPSTTMAVSTIYHHAVIAIGHGGAAAAINPHEVRTRVIDAGGGLVGLMPNAPSSLDVKCLSGNLPWLRWVYSAAGEQIGPHHFEVYQGTGAGEVDLATAIATVPYTRGRTGYDWVGAALSSGDERHYTVRAVSPAGVKSLIPRLGICPSGSYTAVERARCPKLIVPGGAPEALTAMHLEAV